VAISLDPVVSYFLFSVGIRWAIRSISSSVFQLGRFGDPDRIALILVSSYYGPIFSLYFSTYSTGLSEYWFLWTRTAR
jgi:hypothetical protein